MVLNLKIDHNVWHFLNQGLIWVSFQFGFKSLKLLPLLFLGTLAVPLILRALEEKSCLTTISVVFHQSLLVGRIFRRIVTHYNNLIMKVRRRLHAWSCPLAFVYRVEHSPELIPILDLWTSECRILRRHYTLTPDLSHFGQGRLLSPFLFIIDILLDLVYDQNNKFLGSKSISSVFVKIYRVLVSPGGINIVFWETNQRQFRSYDWALRGPDGTASLSWPSTLFFFKFSLGLLLFLTQKKPFFNLLSHVHLLFLR